VLLDFGLSIEGGDVVRSSRRRNGAPEYKAPEKWDDEAILTEQSDIYSFGIVLYQYLAGRTPFPYNSNMSPYKAEYELGKAHLIEAPPSIETLRKAFFEKKFEGQEYRKDYPQWLEEVILKCLRKNPAERFRNGKELYDHIKEFENRSTHFSLEEGTRLEQLNARNDELELEIGRLREINRSLNIVLNEKINTLQQKEKSLQEAKENSETLQKKNESLEQRVEQLLKKINEKEGGDTIESTENKNNTSKVVELSNLNLTVNNVTFTMVYVDGGTFTMGGTTEQGDDCDNNELPIHQVTLNGFYVGETEVTRALWKAVRGSNQDYNESDMRPVDFVSWNDCQLFIDKLNQLTGKSFRLPTEAEWEYAARGGNRKSNFKFSGSNHLDEVAWYASNSDGRTHSVKGKRSNEIGLYDMSGNLCEWCADWHGYYSASPQTNPLGPSAGMYKILRGGSWANGPSYCRVSKRDYASPDFKSSNVGFRLALIPD
jgi:formylglycine-generating enzyme required for sulfatase activity